MLQVSVALVRPSSRTTEGLFGHFQHDNRHGKLLFVSAGVSEGGMLRSNDNDNDNFLGLVEKWVPDWFTQRLIRP
jgi:hypothetical protein